MQQGQVECGSLSADEIAQATRATWPRTGSVTSIAYTFDSSVISQQERDWIYANFGRQSKLAQASDSTRFWVESMLNAWQDSCNGLIDFIYESKPKSDFSGIVIIQCDNLKKASGFMRPSFNQVTNDLIKAQVCIPSNAGTDTLEGLFSLSTITHELGHAIGLKHLHSIPSVREKLKATLQGWACSVMPYLSSITDSKKNYCVDSPNCLNSTFAVKPGPFDEQLCQTNYQASSSFFKLQPSSTYKTLSANVACVANIATEQILYGFLSQLTKKNCYLFNPSTAKLLTMLISRGTMTALGILEPFSTLAFSALEVTALFFHNKAALGVLQIRFFLSIIFLLNLLNALFIDENSLLLAAGFILIGFAAYFTFNASLNTGIWLAKKVNHLAESSQIKTKTSDIEQPNSSINFFKPQPPLPDIEQGFLTPPPPKTTQ